MKKFTRLWQLMVVLMLSSSVMFAQERLEKGISSSAINPGDQTLEKYSDDQIKELKSAGYLENSKALDESAMKSHMAKKALETPQKNAKFGEVKAKNGGQPTDDLFCPGDAVYSLPANGFTSAGTSDVGPGYIAAQQFFGAYVIDSIHWWGIRQYHDGTGWLICDEDPKSFEIIFYEDNAGVPGTVVGTYNATIVGDSSGSLFSGGEVMEYTYALSGGPITLSNGWISIQEKPEGDATCWFLWVNSGTVGPSGAQDAGTGWGLSGYSFSLCLYGEFALTDDLVTTNVTAPNSGFLTAAETVTMEIFNNGSVTQSDIPVSFSLDGAAAVPETYAGPLAPGEYGTYTFTQTIDCSTQGTIFSLECCANLVGDVNTANDCYTHGFASFAPFDCDWYIVGFDSYGDGWNNGAIEIFLDGISVFTYTGPTSLQGQTADTAYFGIWEGSVLTTALISGSYDYEMSYYIYNNFDVEEANDGVGGVDPAGVTIDPVTCIAPACPDPSIVNTGLITQTTARGFWLKGDTETLWNLEYGPNGFAPGTGAGTMLTGLTNPNPFGDPYYDFSGLTEVTYYDWYVQADCGSDVSAWIGPETFRTGLPTVAIPVLEDFETPAKGFNITGNALGNTMDWVVVDTMSYGGISSAYTGVYGVNNINIMDLLVQVDLSAKVNAQLTFWHIAKTEGEWDHCFVEISTDGGQTFTQIPEGYYIGSGDYTLPGFNIDPPNDGPCFDEESYPEWGTSDTPLNDTMWMQEKFNLTPYNTFTDVTIRFRLWTDGSVARAGWMIDDIVIEELACPPPTDVALDALAPTAVTVSWNSLAGLSNFEWDTAGFTPGTGTLLTGVASPQVLSSLMPNTTYDVYVQDDCTGSVSDWVSYSFTTSCTECPVGSIPEGEMCGDSTNNGCNLLVPAFTTVADGVTICGNTWDDGATKDTDYYQLDLATGYNKVTIAASGDVDLIFGLLEQTVPGLAGCDNLTGFITPIIYPSACDTTTLEIFLEDPGTYYFWIAQEFWTGNVCPGSTYWASWTVENLGAPVALIDPASYTVAVPELGATTRDLTIDNTGGFPLAYSAAVEYPGATALFSETFDTEIPATWTHVIYSGTGDWAWTNLSATFNGSDGNFAQANDGDFPADYDVGLFTPAIDMTGHASIVLEFDRDFQDYAGYGIATVKTYSGGTGVANFEEELLFLTNDDPSGGVHTVLSFDPSAYVDPANVYVEFYYTDEAYATAWHFKFDNVTMTAYSGPIGWLTLDGGSAVSGALLAAEQDIVTVGFDAAGLAIGTYYATIAVETNEPASDASYTIPVTFIVAQSYTVSGVLTYANGSSTVMDQVDISLMFGPTEVDATTTDEFGAFTFTTINGTFSYMASTTKPRGGENVADINLQNDHILGLITMVGLQYDAADVNIDGTVNASDINELNDEILGINLGWIAPDYLFENPAVVVADANLVQNFQSLCSGDPNGSFIPPNFCPPATDLAVSNQGEVTWTSGAGLSNLEYGPTGFVLGTGTMMTGVTSPTTVTGAAFDVIDIYVQDDCGGLSQSDWVGPVTYTVPGPGSICETAVSIPALPFVVSGLTTCGFGDDYSSLDACLSSYMNGDDFVFEFTPAADMLVDIALTNTDTWVGVFVTEGCPDVGTCVDYNSNSGGNPALGGVSLTGAVTYYITISTFPTPDCTPFDISITEGVADYCTVGVGPTSTADSNVEQVDMTGDAATAISFTGCPGVVGVIDQTAQIVDITIGSTYTLDVTFGTCGGNYGGAGEVWIDWNADLVFDATEVVGTSAGTPGTAPWDLPVSFSITVPATAVVGATRMRVMQRESGTNPLDPCGSYSWGSVMDFTVNVQ